MAKWSRELNLQPEWGEAMRGDISPQDMALVISDRLGALREFRDPLMEEERIEIADQFRDFSDDPDSEEFDYIMEALYDWADTQIAGEGFFDAVKACWVKTF